MSIFLRSDLQAEDESLCNYAVRPPSRFDLSLVSGPFIWADEIARACRRIDSGDIHTYPLPAWDPELLAAIAEWENVPVESIYLSSGADSAIEIILGRYLGPGDTLGILVPNFPRFAIVGTTLPGVTVAPFSDLAQIPAQARVVAICTPNNPTTSEMDRTELRGVIAANPETLFLIDSVFDWYGTYSQIEACREFDNVLVLKSFSKIGLAGLRLGYVCGPPDLIQELALGTSPFAVPAVIQNIGREIAHSFGRLDELKAVIRESFAPLANAFGDRIVRHTELPFYLLRTTPDSTTAAQLLSDAGVATVDCAHCPDLPPHHLRIAIGTPDQNRALLEAVDRAGLIG